jgi:hypothetical protein
MIGRISNFEWKRLKKLVNDSIYILTVPRKTTTSSAVHDQTIDQKIGRPIVPVQVLFLANLNLYPKIWSLNA